MSVRLLHGDARQLPLDDESVDLIVTSPPYFALRDYKDGDQSLAGQIGSEATPEDFLQALWTCTQEWQRVLKSSGSLWVNLGDKYGNKTLLGIPWRYAIGCIDDLGLILRAEVIWSKPNGLPESVTDRVRRSHEHWFHFTKSPRYFSAVDEIREQHAQVSLDRAAPHRANVKAHEDRHVVDMTRACNPLGKLPGSVWTIPTEPLHVPDELGVDHFAAFPTEWPRRLILGWSPSAICDDCGDGLRPVVHKEGESTYAKLGKRHAVNSDAQRYGNEWNTVTASGSVPHFETRRATITGYACACDEPGDTRPAVVLDPFCGTGTTVAVAKVLGRDGIGVDLSADYLRLAEWRCNGDGYRRVQSKVLGTKPDKVTQYDVPLFDVEAL